MDCSGRLELYGTVVGSVNGSTTVGTGSKIVPSRRQFAFTVPNQENISFTARIRASEWDTALFSDPFRDDRMNNIFTQKSHWFRSGEWTDGSNPSTGGTMTLGNDDNCQLRVSYSFSSAGA